MKPKEPSLLFIVSVVVAFITLFFSTNSPLVLLFVPIYLLPLFIHERFPRDSALIWGGRLFVYAACALLGRSFGSSQTPYQYGVQAFVTMGLVLGGELVLQSFREPPEGFKFDPLQFLVSSLLFLIACGTYSAQIGFQAHLWIGAPLWTLLTLLAMGDVREGRIRLDGMSRVRQGGLLAITICVGYLGHSVLSSNRGELMSLGSRLLSESRPNVSEAGVADAPSLGSSFNNNSSTARMLRITGTLSDSHLRVGAFDSYNNGTWGTALSSRVTVGSLPEETRRYKKYAPGAPANSEDVAERTDWDAKVTVLRDTNKNIFVPLNASALLSIEGSDFDWYRFAGPVQVTDEPPFSYGIVNSRTDIQGVQTEQGPLCISLDPKSLDPKSKKYRQDMAKYYQDLEFLTYAREDLLRVPPEIETGVKQMALDITKGASTQQQKIDAISKYLLENYKYSLEFVRGTQDPISDFLLNKKSAHCQYFASAAVMLMREVGIPARYATGFWAHETELDGTTIVRGRDAHAWAEAYVDNVGWINVETTPPSGRADPAANPLTWQQKAQERAEDNWTRIRNWFGNLGSLQIAGIMVAMLCIWGLERWRQARKKARNRPAKPLPPLELQPLARGFEAALKKRGITLLDGQTWSEVVPDNWNQGLDFVSQYNTARFADRDETQLRELTSKLRSIQKEK